MKPVCFSLPVLRFFAQRTRKFYHPYIKIRSRSEFRPDFLHKMFTHRINHPNALPAEGERART